TGAEERAFRINAVRRRREHRKEVGLGIVLVVAIDARADFLAGQGKRHHDDPFILTYGHATEADAEVGERGNLQLDLGAIGKGMVVELFLFHHETHERHENRQAEAKSSNETEPRPRPANDANHREYGLRSTAPTFQTLTTDYTDGHGLVCSHSCVSVRSVVNQLRCRISFVSLVYF